MGETLDRRRAATAVALLRLGYGTFLMVAPRRMLRLQLGEEPSGPFVWAARSFGARDAILGAGVLLAPDDAARRAWITAGAAADAVDAASAACGAKWLGRGRAVAVLGSAAGAVAAAGWSLGARS